MIRSAVTLALLALATSAFAQAPAPEPAAPASSPSADTVKPNPDDLKALNAFMMERVRAISTLLRSDLDKANQTLEEFKAQLEALAPTQEASQKALQRGKTAIRFFEEQIAQAREKRQELEDRLKANPDDLESLTRYVNKTVQELLPLASSAPETARKQLDAASEFLTELKGKAQDKTRAAIDRSLKSLSSLTARIDADKARSRLIGQKAAPLAVDTWVNGSPLTDDDLKGKVVLLDFWAVWCGPCIATFPHLREWNEKYADKGLVIIGLTTYYNYDWNEKTNQAARSEGKVAPEKEQAMLVKFAAQHKLTHRFGIGSDYPFSKYYGVTGIPQVIVLDRDGVIRLIKVGSGESNAKEIGDMLEKLLQHAQSVGG
jgi:thiol-disulfide isomerase/thioredoxin